MARGAECGAWRVWSDNFPRQGPTSPLTRVCLPGRSGRDFWLELAPSKVSSRNDWRLFWSALSSRIDGWLLRVAVLASSVLMLAMSASSNSSGVPRSMHTPDTQYPQTTHSNACLRACVHACMEYGTHLLCPHGGNRSAKSAYLRSTCTSCGHPTGQASTFGWKSRRPRCHR